MASQLKLRVQRTTVPIKAQNHIALAVYFIVAFLLIFSRIFRTRPLSKLCPHSSRATMRKVFRYTRARSLPEKIELCDVYVLFFFYRDINN